MNTPLNVKAILVIRKNKHVYSPTNGKKQIHTIRPNNIKDRQKTEIYRSNTVRCWTRSINKHNNNNLNSEFNHLWIERKKDLWNSCLVCLQTEKVKQWQMMRVNKKKTHLRSWGCSRHVSACCFHFFQHGIAPTAETTVRQRDLTLSSHSRCCRAFWRTGMSESCPVCCGFRRSWWQSLLLWRQSMTAAFSASSKHWLVHLTHTHVVATRHIDITLYCLLSLSHVHEVANVELINKRKWWWWRRRNITMSSVSYVKCAAPCISQRSSRCWSLWSTRG